MDNKIIVVGIGPGSEDYILPLAVKKIKEAKVLVGGQRALDGFALSNQETIVIKSDTNQVVQAIREKLQTTDVTVMVSGDPGFHSMLVLLRKEFADKNIEVVPGISSLQLAFSRIGRPWQDAELFSLHGKEQTQDFLQYREKRIVGMLTDNKNTPSVIADRLKSANWPDESECYICSKLSYEDEQVVKLTLAQMRQSGEYKNCVVVVFGV